MVARNLFIAGVTAMVGVIALIVLDWRTQQLEKLVSYQRIESVGETA